MKEPKEEAERIIEMFRFNCKHTEYIDENRYKHSDTIKSINAKQCAILHVEGIVKLVSYPQTNIKRKKYWQEVLQIIKDK